MVAATHKIVSAIIAIVCLCTLSSCIHVYPEIEEDGAEGVDPTLVRVATLMDIDLKLEPLLSILSSRAGENTGAVAQRFVVEALRGGVVESRAVAYLTAEEAAEMSEGESLKLPVHISLHAQRYTLVVWSDFVYADSHNPLHYDVSTLDEISHLEPYVGSTEHKQCFRGSADVDLHQYRDTWNVKVEVPVSLTRPLARYTLVATDVDEFVKRVSGNRSSSGYTMTVSYNYYIPTHFNAHGNYPCRQSSGISYSTPIEPHKATDGSLAVAYDYIFMGSSDMNVSITVSVADANGKVVSQIAGIDVPLTRGKHTTISGNLLTNGLKGGININTDWGNDIIIDLD